MNLLAKKLGKETGVKKKSNKLCPSPLSAGDASLLGFVSGTLREREKGSRPCSVLRWNLPLGSSAFDPMGLRREREERRTHTHRANRSPSPLGKIDTRDGLPLNVPGRSRVRALGLR